MYVEVFAAQPCFSLHGILQARILEWVAISFSKGSSWPRDQTWVSWIAGMFITIWGTREALCKLLEEEIPRGKVEKDAEIQEMVEWPKCKGQKKKKKNAVNIMQLCHVVVVWSLNLAWLFVIPRIVAWQPPLSMGFPRQGFWSGLPFPPPGYLLSSGRDSVSPTWQVDSLHWATKCFLELSHGTMITLEL